MSTSSTSILIRTRIIPQAEGFSLLSISPRLALMYRALKRPGKGGRMDKIQCAYFGFSTAQEAKTFASYVSSKHESAFVMQRETKRLDAAEFPYEVKIREFPGLMSLVYRAAAKASEVRDAA